MRRALGALFLVAVVGASAAYAVFAQAQNPVISLSTGCGTVGTALTVNGSGFAPGNDNLPITVTFDPGGSPPASVTVPPSAISGTGSFSATLTVPSRAQKGTAYSVVATQSTPAGGQVSAPPALFYIPCPGLNLVPNCGSTGDVVAVLGSGFRTRQTLTIWFAQPPSGRGQPNATALPAADGTFRVGVAVPSLRAGSYVVTAVQVLTGFAANVQLVATATLQIPCSKAEIVIKPAVGPPGTVATVIGTGFPANAVVKLTWNQGIPLVLQPIVIGASQGFTVQVLIFPHDELGTRTMSASPDLTVPNAPLFNITTATFLVVPGSEQPHDFIWRH